MCGLYSFGYETCQYKPQYAFKMSMFMCPAVHINSRSLLRSSSTHEPSDPPLRVIFYFCSSFALENAYDCLNACKISVDTLFQYLNRNKIIKVKLPSNHKMRKNTQ